MADLTLYLLRHGESAANVKRVFASLRIDPPLSDAGIRQAAAQAESLKDIEFSAIYSSHLLRARQTAEIVGQRCGIGPTISEALHEVDVGILDGKDQDAAQNWEDFMSIMGEWNRGFPDAGFPGGETLNDVEARLRAFLDGLGDEREKPVLVVGHSLVFMAIFWLFCEPCSPEFHDGYMGRGHLSVISGNDGKFRILKFNIPPGELEDMAG